MKKVRRSIATVKGGSEEPDKGESVGLNVTTVSLCLTFLDVLRLRVLESDLHLR